MIPNCPSQNGETNHVYLANLWSSIARSGVFSIASSQITLQLPKQEASSRCVACSTRNRLKGWNIDNMCWYPMQSFGNVFCPVKLIDVILLSDASLTHIRWDPLAHGRTDCRIFPWTAAVHCWHVALEAHWSCDELWVRWLVFTWEMLLDTFNGFCRCFFNHQSFIHSSLPRIFKLNLNISGRELHDALALKLFHNYWPMEAICFNSDWMKVW